MPDGPATGALELLAGDPEAFLTEAWGSAVHLHRTKPERLVGLLTLDDVDRMLTTGALRTPALRLARDGQVLAESAYTTGGSLAGRPLTGLVDPRRALDRVREGATLVLQGLHRSWEPLGDLVAELELELGHPCQANAYLTPPAAQGFAVHEDAHDVFVLQTEGAKLWEVHTPQGTEEVLLEPGLCMYLPAGTPHAARAQDSMSLHVTLGINQATWRGLLERVVREELALLGDERLPAGSPESPDAVAEGLTQRLADLSRRLREVDPREAAERWQARFLTSRLPRTRGGLRDLAALPAVDDDTRLRRRPGRPVVLRPGEQRLTVLLGDRSLGMPRRLEPAMRLVHDRRELVPADLAEAGLDEQSRLVLCRRLVREGLLEVVA
jgi:lysine-specific demethylase/histidyl-hydroxylase NO66